LSEVLRETRPADATSDPPFLDSIADEVLKMTVKSEGEKNRSISNSNHSKRNNIFAGMRGPKVDKPKEIIEELIKVGSQFTYANFSKKSNEGYPEAFKPEWSTWTTRVQSAIVQLLDVNSGPAKLVTQASQIKLIGYGSRNFDNVYEHYCSALRVALEILDKDTFGELLKQETAIAPKDLTNKVFIVHGRDEASKNELEIMLRDMGLEPVVLHRQVDSGLTIIEKFEAHADVGYAFIIMTPDEIAYLADEDNKLDGERKKQLRARQNVVWEFGYFVGRLSRKRTCCLHKADVKIPSDLNGLVYKQFEKSVEEVGWAIRKELKAAGYKLAD